MALKSSETNWRTRRMTGNDDNYHDLPDATSRSCQQEKSHTIDLIEVEYNSYQSIDHDHQPEMLQWTE